MGTSEADRALKADLAQQLVDASIKPLRHLGDSTGTMLRWADAGGLINRIRTSPDDSVNAPPNSLGECPERFQRADLCRRLGATFTSLGVQGRSSQRRVTASRSVIGRHPGSRFDGDHQEQRTV